MEHDSKRTWQFWNWNTFILLLIMVFLLYKYLTRNFGYWKKRNVNFVKPLPFFGNFIDVALTKQSAHEWTRDIYNKIDEEYFGAFVFGRPVLIIKDPKLVKSLLIKDYVYFRDRSAHNSTNDPIDQNLMFFQKSPNWKPFRSKLSPAFSSGKLKKMFESVNKVGEHMVEYINKKCLNKITRAKEVTTRFSTDVIAQTAFGIEANSFVFHDAEFLQVGRTMFEFSFSNAINQLSYFFFPHFIDVFHLTVLGKKNKKFLRNVLFETIENRAGNNTQEGDIIDILLKLKSSGHQEFAGDRLVAPAMNFFIAGYETTSSAISHTLYELCINKTLQDRLRQEVIENIAANDGITYEGVQSMNYLTMCLRETLRKYPTLPFLDRQCNEDYLLPGTNLWIKKGDAVYIPTWGQHYDEKYFPNPHHYDPERFRDMSKINENGMLYYMPFGDGPRNCIGERLAYLNIKLALVHIISQFEVVPSELTKIPLKLEPKSILSQSICGVPIYFRPIK